MSFASRERNVTRMQQLNAMFHRLRK